jgi:predicted amino acid dehydrogenase
MLKPEHLKKDALVLDISVPSNVHPSVFSERADVECVQGGFARLPLGQKLDDCALVFAPEGEIFACMAETLTLGLLNHPESFSRGPLSKERILRITRMARDAGIELGSVKRFSAV